MFPANQSIFTDGDYLNVLTVSAVSNSIDSAKRARAHLILKLVELSYIAFILLYEPLSLH